MIPPRSTDGASTAAVTALKRIPVGGFLVDEPFTFTGEVVVKTWRMFTAENVNRRRSHFPGDLVFMSQICFGVTSLLAHLRARVCGRKTLIECVYEPGDTVPAPWTNEALAELGLGAPLGRPPGRVATPK